jgi:glycosyltransferase involved in cell wall biosynthesis
VSTLPHLVSVLTPSFNQGRFIGDCLQSVRRQTYRPIEHVVCDGGSTDESVEILAGAEGEVRWVSEPDRGQSHALNKALALANGTVIGWLNSDDAYFDTTAVEAAVDVFERRSEVDVVYGHAALVNADGLVLHMMWVPPPHRRILRLLNPIVQPAVFIRRSALGEIAVNELFHYSMDRELWLRLLRDGRRFARVDRVLAIDRHHATRKVYTRPDLARADEGRLIAEYGVPPNARFRSIRKPFKIASRLLALRLALRRPGPLAFSGRLGPRRALVVRQLVVPRRAMRMESPGAE